MKKLLLIFALFSCSSISCMAQASTMTAAELKFRNEIEKFLKEEGYAPTIDDEDNSLNWKKEGQNYWLKVKFDNPTYVEIHKSGFGIEDTNHRQLLEACNRASLETRCAKVYVTSTSVSFSVEVYCSTANEFKYIFYRSIACLDTAKEKAKKYYNND